MEFLSGYEILKHFPHPGKAEATVVER